MEWITYMVFWSVYIVFSQPKLVQCRVVLCCVVGDENLVVSCSFGHIAWSWIGNVPAKLELLLFCNFLLQFRNPVLMNQNYCRQLKGIVVAKPKTLVWWCSWPVLLFGFMFSKCNEYISSILYYLSFWRNSFVSVLEKFFCFHIICHFTFLKTL